MRNMVLAFTKELKSRDGTRSLRTILRSSMEMEQSVSSCHQTGKHPEICRSRCQKAELNKLGGTEWNKTKTRVKGAVQEIARDLVKLYAARQRKMATSTGRYCVAEGI